MDGEPIDLAQLWDKTRLRRWHTAGNGPWDEVDIELGQLGDGRFYSHTTEPAVVPNAWAWPDRARAEEHVTELLAERTGWVDAPAWFDARGQPHGELGPWKKIGRRWVLDD
jgi:hypothetical protein